jgi:hypothetical protein
LGQACRSNLCGVREEIALTVRGRSVLLILDGCDASMCTGETLDYSRSRWSSADRIASREIQCTWGLSFSRSGLHSQWGRCRCSQFPCSCSRRRIGCISHSKRRKCADNSTPRSWRIPAGSVAGFERCQGWLRNPRRQLAIYDNRGAPAIIAVCNRVDPEQHRERVLRKARRVRRYRLHAYERKSHRRSATVLHICEQFRQRCPCAPRCETQQAARDWLARALAALRPRRSPVRKPAFQAAGARTQQGCPHPQDRTRFRR